MCGTFRSFAALDGGAAVIDIKEPLAVRWAVLGHRWDEVLRCVQDRVPVSVALGELTDGALPRRLRHLPPVSFAKVGLASCRSLPDWLADGVGHWSTFPPLWPPSPSSTPIGNRLLLRRRLTSSAAPSNWAAAPCCGILFSKEGGRLFHHLPVSRLAPLVQQTQRPACWLCWPAPWAWKIWRQSGRCAPDLVAVRGAVCNGTRVATVQQLRVSQFVQALAAGDHGTLRCIPYPVLWGWDQSLRDPLLGNVMLPKSAFSGPRDCRFDARPRTLTLPSDFLLSVSLRCPHVAGHRRCWAPVKPIDWAAKREVRQRQEAAICRDFPSFA